MVNLIGHKHYTHTVSFPLHKLYSGLEGPIFPSIDDIYCIILKASIISGVVSLLEENGYDNEIGQIINSCFKNLTNLELATVFVLGQHSS